MLHFFATSYGEELDAIWEIAQTLPSRSICVGLEPNVSLDGSRTTPDEPRCPGGASPADHVFLLGENTPLVIETSYARLPIGSCDPSTPPPRAVELVATSMAD